MYHKNVNYLLYYDLLVSIASIRMILLVDGEGSDFDNLVSLHDFSFIYNLYTNADNYNR